MLGKKREKVKKMLEFSNVLKNTIVCASLNFNRLSG